MKRRYFYIGGYDKDFPHKTYRISRMFDEGKEIPEVDKVLYGWLVVTEVTEISEEEYYGFNRF